MLYREGYFDDGAVISDPNSAVVLFALRHLYNEGLVENVPPEEKNCLA